MTFYITTLLVYLGVDIIAIWGLNVQYGVAGLVNFSFIVFQAMGAYVAAVLTLGSPSANGGFQRFILGAQLPFPLPIIAAGIAAGLLSLPIGWVVLRRLRTDYQAMVMLVVSICATLLVTNAIRLFNGPAGLALVPQPLTSLVNAQTVAYQWFYVAITAALCAITYLFVHRVTGSPLGRALRATRDNEAAAAALGKNVSQLRLFVFVFGNVLAGISGAVLVQFIGVWSPGAWLYVETFVYFTAIIIGGTGNNAGVMLGALLVPVLFSEATRFLPQFAGPDLIGALQWIVTGLLALVFLWFWPRGVIPERRRRFPPTAPLRQASRGVTQRLPSDTPSGSPFPERTAP